LKIKNKTSRDQTTLWIKLVCAITLIHALFGHSWSYFLYSKRSIRYAIFI